MWAYIRVRIKNNNKMNTELIFKGITTSELISYKVAGDNSKELKAELERRISIEIESRKGKTNNTELDARYNG
jgi:hypothetical protein